MSTVRVRIAPSPTGPTHVGTAYQALFDKVYAEKFEGKFILRIEDTDQERSRVEYEDQLIESLRWLGLEWDEGPDVGGEYGPYRQSERLSLYQRCAQELVKNGRAYLCFCSTERLANLRGTQQKNKERQGYDRHCRNLTETEVSKYLDEAQSFVIRLKMPQQGSCVVEDCLRGNIEFDLSEFDDQVLLKSDGYPTYHLAVVVDDHHMRISHVIRGEEWITSTPKHLSLYEAFGWQPPEYLHLPLLLNPDGSKMSKRRNPTSIEYYRRAGYDSDALLNYLALMAYSPIKEEDKFSFRDLVEVFDVDQINLGGSIFDLDKLNWLNGRYLREERTPLQIVENMEDWLLNSEYLTQLVPLLQQRMETLGDFVPKAAFFFARSVDPAVEDLLIKGRDQNDAVLMLQTAIWALDEVSGWKREPIETAVRSVADYWQWPVREVTVPLTVAVTGGAVGPPLFDTLHFLGKDMVIMRLLQAMSVLGGLSKKKSSKLEKDWNR